MRHRIPLAATVLVLCGCGETVTEPAGIEPQLAVTAGQQVPFRARHTSEVSEASDLDCAPGEIPGRSVFVRGNATHLGNYTGEGTGCIVPATLQSSSAAMVMIAANGDEVWFEMDPDNPQVWTITVTPEGVVVESAAGFDIVGGTGRWEGATGYVLAGSTRTITAGPSPTTAWAEGTISSPGSIR